MNDSFQVEATQVASESECRDASRIRSIEAMVSGSRNTPLDLPVEWWFSESDEYYSSGGFGSEEEAIEEAKATYDPGTRFVLGVGTYPNLAAWFNTANILESMQESYDELMWMEESLDEFWSLTVEQRADLELRLKRVFAEWIADHSLNIPACITESRWLRIPEEPTALESAPQGEHGDRLPVSQGEAKQEDL